MICSSNVLIQHLSHFLELPAGSCFKTHEKILSNVACHLTLNNLVTRLHLSFYLFFIANLYKNFALCYILSKSRTNVYPTFNTTYNNKKTPNSLIATLIFKALSHFNVNTYKEHKFKFFIEIHSPKMEYYSQ